MKTKDHFRFAYQKQGRDKQETQPDKSTAQKMTKMRLTNLQQL